jgi:hypothetical protein
MRGIGLAGLGIYQIVIRMALLSLMDISGQCSGKGKRGRNTWYKYASGKGKEKKKEKKKTTQPASLMLVRKPSVLRV